MSSVGCELTLAQSLDIFSDSNTAFAFFKSHQVFDTPVVCPKCSHSATLNQNRLVWRCVRSTIVNGIQTPCKFEQSYKTSTWLKGSKIPIYAIGRLIAYFLLLPPPHQRLFHTELGISDPTIVKWCHQIRQAELDWCLEHTARTLGGPGTVIGRVVNEQ